MLLSKVIGALAVLALVACRASSATGDAGDDAPGGAPPSAPTAPAGVAPEAPWPEVDTEQGRALIERYECHRCHAGTLLGAPPPERDCSGCHRAIRAGGFLAPRGLPFVPAPERLAEWREHVRHGLDVPTLEGSTRRLRRGWIASFLARPHDLRPALEDTMPELPIAPEDARRLAAFLGSNEQRAVAPPGGELARGRRLLDERGCGSCHVFSGVEPLRRSPIPVTLAPEVLASALTGAPDLRHARERFGTWTLVAWLRRPHELKADTAMPSLGLGAHEARDVAAYLIAAPLAPVAPLAIPSRWPLLDRQVTYLEVEARVLRRSCWHCHSDPDYAFGDGGPGNTGGFGFAGRGIELASYEGLRNGYRGSGDEQRSLLQPEKFSLSGASDPVPLARLVAALFARHFEVAGQRIPGVRGMPLGLPPLPLADLQLVETWVAQGAPR